MDSTMRVMVYLIPCTRIAPVSTPQTQVAINPLISRIAAVERVTDSRTSEANIENQRPDSPARVALTKAINTMVWA